MHPSLQNPVRLRIEGERIGLPGPALTPYLVGLLVMLGMLGTFLGMVVTLNGAVLCAGRHHRPAGHPRRAGGTDQGPGAGLRHLGGRRCRVGDAGPDVGHSAGAKECWRRSWLDTAIATALRGFSLTHQRQETCEALQSQARALPEVVDQMQAMMAQMERRASS